MCNQSSCTGEGWDHGLRVVITMLTPKVTCLVSPPEKGWAEKILDRILGTGERKEAVSRIQLCAKRSHAQM